MGWRKGADIEEEMWPVEAFGGVTDQQFWDDLASDKPLATTARTADAAPRGVDAAGRRVDAGARSADSGPRRQSAAHTAPGPAAANQTMVQPAAHAATPAAHAAAPAPIATQPYPAMTQPSPSATQPVRAAHQPTETRGRRSAYTGGFSADEDPLTSPAYSLRAKGAVDGRSYLASPRSRDLPRDPYQTAPYQTAQSQEMLVFGTGRPTAARPDPLRPEPLRSDSLRSDRYGTDPLRSDGYRTDPLRSDGYRPGSPDSSGPNATPIYQSAMVSASGYGGTVGNPYPERQYSQPSHSVTTPPYGDMLGYRNPVSPAGDPRQANGAWGNGRAGAGDANWGSRQAYPPVNGYRSPYDPRGNDRRLRTAAV